VSRSSGPLPPRTGYRLWAPHYHGETAVSALEAGGVERITPPLAGRALLDAGCGTGRRLADAHGVRFSAGVDLVPEMLRAGRRHGAVAPMAAADLRALPLRSALFDVIWCRLVLGHLWDPAPAYAELARVAAPVGAVLVVSDFHPAAVAAGHARTFRDAGGRLHVLEHHVHTAASHERAAKGAGWRLRVCQELAVGPAIRSFYEEAGVLAAYRAQLGLPLVLLLRFGR